jgi:hypothetical protein
MRATVLRTFSVPIPHNQKTLEILEKWKHAGLNISENINKAIVVFDSLSQEDKMLFYQKARGEASY